MGYERNDRRPGGYSGERGNYGGDRWRTEGRDEQRGGGYGTYGGAGARDYRGDRLQDDGRRDYDRDPRGYDYDRGFFERAGDEVRSWFGDDEAERRRRDDERRDEAENRYGGEARYRGASDDRDRGRSGYGGHAYAGDPGQRGAWAGAGGSGTDRGRDDGQHAGYQSWRDRQMQAFDRDYEDYRRENQSRFDQEFHSWRQGRQGQRDLLGKVREHQEVIGSDGQHIGTVDHVRGDDIKLTKSDEAAGGRHHLIPASWIKSVDDKVTLDKTADQAKQQWRDVARDGGGGLFGRDTEGDTGRSQTAAHPFDRAFGDTDKQR